MADQRIQYTEKMVGNGHPTLSDTLNRLSLVAHNSDGSHKGYVEALQEGSFAATLAAVPATTQIVITTVIEIAGPLTIAHPLEVKPGGLLVITSGTVTINGPFSCGLFQCFDGGGDVVFGSGSVLEVYPGWFGSTTSSDSFEAFDKAIRSLSVSGGVINGNDNTYSIETGNLLVNQDNTTIKNVTLTRNGSSTTGYLIRFATTVDTTGGGLEDVTLIGNNTIAASAGLGMGSANGLGDGFSANSYTLSNVKAKTWGQYGIGIEAGSNWLIKDIRIEDHGLITGSISSCMGFYIYPKVASKNGRVYNVYSQISDACVANASANTAAVKLQTHQNLIAENITAVYGFEEAISIDSIDGVVSNLKIICQTNRPGLTVGNYNPAHSFTGQKFVVDGVYINGSTAFGIAISGEDGQSTLTGCVVRNVSGQILQVSALAYYCIQDCVFENWIAEDIRLSSAERGYSVNSKPSSNNIFSNIKVTGGLSTGQMAIETSDSVITNCGLCSLYGDTVGSFNLYGSNNVIKDPYVQDSASNAMAITGNNNDVYNLNLKNIVGRSVWFKTSSNNNRVYSGTLYEGSGPLDNGYNNYVYGLRKKIAGTSYPGSGVWSLGDRCENTSGTVGQPKGWICTTAGGSYSGTRANTTAYTVGLWRKWATGTTVYECTTAGTSAGSEPSPAVTVGETITDGTVVWTCKSLTAAVWTSEGNL